LFQAVKDNRADLCELQITDGDTRHSLLHKRKTPP